MHRAVVTVVAKTSPSAAQGTFDFSAEESSETVRSFAVAGSATCVRTDSGDITVHGEIVGPSFGQQLLNIRRGRDGRFVVQRPKACRLWRVVRTLPAARHALQEGDIVKLGRRGFRVRQLVQDSEEDDDDDGGHSCLAESECQSSACRICLEEGPGENGPLVSPCGCRGSIQHVHVGCLQRWVRGQVDLTNASQGYSYQPPRCELCKTGLPSSIMLGDGVARQMLDLPKPEAPFIVLESTESGVRHCLSLAPSQRNLVTLGRGDGCDVRIVHNSVSRRHASIRFDSGEFIFEDHNSKFGTLVDTRKKAEVLAPHTPFVVQAGPTLLTLTLQPWLDLAACDMVPMPMPHSVHPHTDAMQTRKTHSDLEQPAVATGRPRGNTGMGPEEMGCSL